MNKYRIKKYDPDKNRLYYITGYDTGNNEIAIRHYFDVLVKRDEDE